jgi:phosphoglycerol geranylgeranyltransferase
VIYALAAQYLGMRSLYLEAGSGSSEPVPPETISMVRRFYSGILIVGGGITSPKAASRASAAGATILVVGNLLQEKGWEKELQGLARVLSAPKRS